MADATPAYLHWLNDPRVNQFLESRFERWTLAKLKAFIRVSERQGGSYLFLAIVLKDGQKHIGNVKVGPINERHHFAEVGILIGEESAWGHGYGSEVVRLVSRYCFKKMGLRKLLAGIYANNYGSLKAFKRAGFYQAARLKKHRFFKGRYVDEIIVEKIIK